MPKVSIVIPVYNASKAIEKCIRSIFDEDYKDLEIIAVDDGSKDDSGTILDNLAKEDSRLVVVHKENGGVSKARNTAFKYVTGQYIQFMDSDDYIPKDSTKMLVRTIEESNADMVIGSFYRVVKDNVSIKSSITTNKVLTLQEYAEEMMESPSDFYYGVLWNKLYKTSIIKDNDLKMDESLSFCEDFIFNMEYLIHCNTIAPLQVPVYYYIKTEGSLVTQSMSISKIYNMKVNVYSYYTQFFKNVLDEKQYSKDRIAIARFLVDGAKDDAALSILPSTKKLGDEQVVTHFIDERNNDVVLLSYYLNKLLDKNLLTIAYKNDLDLRDLKIIHALYLMNKATSKQISDLSGLSKLSVSTRAQYLAFKDYIILSADKDDNTLFSLSDKCNPIVEDLKVVSKDIDNTLYEEFTSEEINILKKYLNRISENIKKHL